MIDEREPKDDLKPMTCTSQSGLWGAPKTQFPNPEVWILGGCERHVVAGDYKGWGKKTERNSERETIFIMERRSLSGKRNYGQTVAAA